MVHFFTNRGVAVGGCVVVIMLTIGFDPGELNKGCAVYDPTTGTVELIHFNLRIFVPVKATKVKAVATNVKAVATNVKTTATKVTKKIKDPTLVNTSNVNLVIHQFITSNKMESYFNKTEYVCIEKQLKSVSIIKQIANLLYQGIQLRYPHITVIWINPRSVRGWWEISVESTGKGKKKEKEDYDERKRLSTTTTLFDPRTMDMLRTIFTIKDDKHKKVGLFHPDSLEAALMIGYFIENTTKVLKAHHKTIQKKYIDNFGISLSGLRMNTKRHKT